MTAPPEWPDELVLEMLDAMADGLTAAAVAARMGTTKNAVLGMRFRCLGPLSQRETPEVGDGTMESGWWRR